MRAGHTNTIDRDIWTLFTTGSSAGLTDAELLERFIVGRDEDAFASIVRRHGPMVLDVCRRVLRDGHDAEDAFQATFLVLARRAASVAPRAMVANWLYGVAHQTAVKARAMAGRRKAREKQVEDLPEAAAPPHPPWDELGPILDQELSRLPAKYRAPVVLCHLEGKSYAAAASELGWPEGTLSGRLSRARSILAERLTRRGLAFSAGSLAAVLPVKTASAGVSTPLVHATAGAACRFVAGVAAARGAVSPEVAALSQGVLTMMRMKKIALNGAVLVGLTGAAGLAVAGFGPGASGLAGGQYASPAAAGSTPSGTSEGRTDRERFDAIRAEWDAGMRAFEEEVARKDRPVAERMELLRTKWDPARAVLARRMVDLAEASPSGPVARDAILWVVSLLRYNYDEKGPFADQVGRAVDLLGRGRAVDLAVARTALLAHNAVSANRDRLFRALYDRAEGREARGTAYLALAEYLKMKGEFLIDLRGTKSPYRVSYPGRDAAGKATTVEVDEPVFDAPYEAGLRDLDPAALSAEAGRLFELVLSDYADVPLARGVAGVTSGHRTEAGRTLGDEARTHLSELRGTVVGREAPQIAGVCLDGTSRKLSDYRGKVVALVCWASWCGPCMQAIPHERELAERLKGRPFALLGVNFDEDEAAARKLTRDRKMAWPNWCVGGAGNGTIAERYQPSQLPTVLVLDAAGIIRFKFRQVPGPALDEAVERLLAELDDGVQGRQSR